MASPEQIRYRRAEEERIGAIVDAINAAYYDITSKNMSDDLQDAIYEAVRYHGYRVKMTNEAHQAFAERLRECKARVILTMSLGTVYDDVLNDWCRHSSNVITNGGTAKPEIIYTNFEPDAGLFGVAS